MTVPARPHTRCNHAACRRQLSHRANPKPDKTHSYTYARPRGSPPGDDPERVEDLRVMLVGALCSGKARRKNSSRLFQ
ncbi:hypothetical protein DIPPA_30215 [Diplonema papillatum]|nr:hypothetical protein DIPPA_30215 [Diplonema papillatum]